MSQDTLAAIAVVVCTITGLILGALIGQVLERYRWNQLIRRGLIPPPPGLVPPRSTVTPAECLTDYEREVAEALAAALAEIEQALGSPARGAFMAGQYRVD